jgi:hypothetical protein
LIFNPIFWVKFGVVFWILKLHYESMSF